MEVLAATEGSALTVKGEGVRTAHGRGGTEPALSETTALRNPLLLLAVADRSVAETLLDAAHADQIPVVEAHSGDASRNRRQIAIADRP